jgi:hypothetical protein
MKQALLQSTLLKILLSGRLVPPIKNDPPLIDLIVLLNLYFLNKNSIVSSSTCSMTLTTATKTPGNYFYYKRWHQQLTIACDILSCEI